MLIGKRGVKLIIKLPFKNNQPTNPNWINPLSILPDGRLCITMGASAIDSYLMCKTYWVYNTVERLRPQPLTINAEDHKTDRGTYGHSLLDCYYKAKARLRHPDPLKTCRDAQQFVIDNLPRLRKESRLLESTHVEIEKAFDFYVTRTLLVKDDFEPINEDSVELGFSQILYEDKDVVYVITGRIDMLSKYKGYNPYVIVDHKFQWQAHVIYDKCPQFRTYSMVTNAPALIVNYIRVYSKTTAVERQLVDFTSQDHKTWKQYIIKNVFEEIDQEFHKQRNGKDIGETLKSLEKKGNAHACQSRYGECIYTPICERMEDVGHPIREYNKRTLYQITEGHIPWI